MQVPPFNSYLGVEIERKEDGVGVVTLELAPHHLNRRGVAHGGVISSLLDSALGAAVISSIPEAWWCATTSLATQFLDGVGEGRLTATGRLLRRGGKVAFADGEVRDSRNRLIATATGTWHLWDHRPGHRRPLPGPFVRLAGGRRLAVGKILAVGRNYADHKAEMGTPAEAPPVVFFKPSSALLGDGGVLRPPAEAGALHHEVELVVVIGTAGRAIPRGRALDHVLGYAVGLDMTLRELQAQAKQRGEPWSLSKGFDGSAPVSRVVARDDVGDESGLEISLDVNGKRKQHGNTDQMLHSVADLIVQLSRWNTLERGDLIFTGTPAGVGPVVAGDRLEARLERVASLAITIESDA